MIPRRLLPNVAALIAGVAVGTLAGSAIVAGLAALVFAGIWSALDHRSR